MVLGLNKPGEKTQKCPMSRNLNLLRHNLLKDFKKDFIVRLPLYIRGNKKKIFTYPNFNTSLLVIKHNGNQQQERGGSWGRGEDPAPVLALLCILGLHSSSLTHFR